MRQLQDVLAEIGLEHVETAALEEIVQAAFLAHHGLRLDDPVHAVLRGDVSDNAVDVIGGLGPVHHGTARRRFLLETR